MPAPHLAMVDTSDGKCLCGVQGSSAFHKSPSDIAPTGRMRRPVTRCPISLPGRLTPPWPGCWGASSGRGGTVAFVGVAGVGYISSVVSDWRRWLLSESFLSCQAALPWLFGWREPAFLLSHGISRSPAPPVPGLGQEAKGKPGHAPTSCHFSVLKCPSCLPSLHSQSLLCFVFYPVPKVLFILSRKRKFMSIPYSRKEKFQGIVLERLWVESTPTLSREELERGAASALLGR